MLVITQWNVADYFNQNKEKLLCNKQAQSSGEETNGNEVTSIDNHEQEQEQSNSQEILYPDFPGVTTSEMSEFDKLWMCLFTKLGNCNNFKNFLCTCF